MPRKKIVTVEEAKIASRLFERKEKLKEAQYLPEPTYYFNVGDEVERGSLRDVIVVDILADGKVYEIDYTSIDNNYGNPITHLHERQFVTWLDIRPVVSTQSHNLIKNEDLRLHYGQTVLITFFGKVYYFRTDMNPEYQRDYVWSPDDNVRLIDSIFMNINIGTFAFVHLPFTDGGFGYRILDGKQRLNAITNYYENRFPYKGLFFNDLTRAEKHHFTDYPVSYAEIENATPQQELRYFYLMNRSGRVMSDEHLRKVKLMIAGEE